MKTQVLGVVVLRISQQLGSKGRSEMGGGGGNMSEMGGGGGNLGGSEMGGSSSSSRGRKYETAYDGSCTNRAFSGHSASNNH